MPISKEKKVEIVKNLAEKLKKAKMIVLADYMGTNVSDMEGLRLQADEKDVSYSVIKNTLAKLAFKEAGIEFDESLFEGPLSIAFSMDDEVAPCKVIHAFSKDHENFKIKAGFEDGKMIDIAYINNLAILPGKEELYPRLVGAIKAPLSRLHGALIGNPRKLVYILNTYKESK